MFQTNVCDTSLVCLPLHSWQKQRQKVFNNSHYANYVYLHLDVWFHIHTYYIIMAQPKYPQNYSMVHFIHTGYIIEYGRIVQTCLRLNSIYREPWITWLSWRFLWPQALISPKIVQVCITITLLVKWQMAIGKCRTQIATVKTTNSKNFTGIPLKYCTGEWSSVQNKCMLHFISYYICLSSFPCMVKAETKSVQQFTLYQLCLSVPWCMVPYSYILYHYVTTKLPSKLLYGPLHTHRLHYWVQQKCVGMFMIEFHFHKPWITWLSWQFLLRQALTSPKWCKCVLQ